MLHKKTLTTLLIANGVYVLYFFLMMLALKQPIIQDLSKPPVTLSKDVLTAIQSVMSILSLLIFVGLGLILNAYKEKPWITASVFVFLILQLVFNVLTVLGLNGIKQSPTLLNALFYVNCVAMLYLVISLLFVKNQLIRPYYLWFACLIVLSMLLVYALPRLYENFGYGWLLISPGLIKIVPYILTLFLFITVSKANKKKTV